MAKGLTDQELKAIIDDEIRQAMGEQGGELSEERATSMERYLGEPDGNEVEGRSRVQARDVMDVIEWILPSLIRIFTSIDRAVELDPVGPEDELQAQQETDFLNYLFYKKNPGFLNIYSWFKDALLSKNGITKTYVEEVDSTKREEYSDLLDEGFYALMADDELELLEHTEKSFNSDMGGIVTLHDVVFARNTKKDQIIVEVIPPEEFLISTDANCINPKKARFSGHHTTKTVSELREMGFAEEDIKLMENGLNAVEYEQERYERLHLTDEQRYEDAPESNEAMQQKKITEGYLYADRNGDGIAEILKIFRSGDFMEAEEVDRVVFNALTPVILTHKFFGLSVADLVRDIQEIRTALLRSYMDNFYQTINGTTYYDENTVNVEDMLTSTPYGIRAVNGAPGQSILHIPPSGLPPEAFSLMDLMKDLRADRIGDFVSQLDPNVIANANNGVVIEMLNEAKAKVEMIARIFAETGVKEQFRDLHELARKHGHHEEIVKLRNDWVPVNPTEWRERTDFTIRVGLGIRNKQEEAVSLRAIMDEQYKALEMGTISPMMMNQETGEQFFPLWESQKRYAHILGEDNPMKYFPPPQFMPPPPPPPPDPQEAVLALTAQIEAEKNRTKQLELQLDAQKSDREAALKEQELVVKSQSEAVRNETNDTKAQIAAIRAEGDQRMKDMQIQMQARFEQEKLSLEKTKLALEEKNEEQKRTLDKYKADLDAATDLLTTKNGQDVETVDSKASDRLLAGLLDTIEDLKTQLSAPKQVVRDGEGRIIQVGSQQVLRDESGLVTGLE